MTSNKLPTTVQTLSPELIQTLSAMRLSHEDYHAVEAGLGRIPNHLELSIFSAMWSEHCSYRTTRHLLRRLPSQSPDVICGPGENAGVVKIADGWHAAFKMESHNHPSMIQPYHGAATGVGGILRDIFSLGARPVAVANSLRFGDPSHGQMSELVRGVVAGIAGYGNSFGVPTITGETVFSQAYNHNILVNALAVGVMKENSLIPSKAPGVNRWCWYVGSPTGLDGVHGAAMASRAFGEHSEKTSLTTVQVGDPFAGKRLMEACLKANENGWISAMQDMGAAGIVSSSVEMAAKADLGLELDLARVPLRNTDMTASDTLLSESQERMLVFPALGHEENLKALFYSCDLEAVAIGHTISEPTYRVMWNDSIIGEAPIQLIVNAPNATVSTAMADVKTNTRTDSQKSQSAKTSQDPLPRPAGDLIDLMTHHLSFANKQSVWQQYDWLVQGATIKGPPSGGCALIELDEPEVSLALSCQGSHWHMIANPRNGVAFLAAKAWLDVAITGARPLAYTDNLNFGSPENPLVAHDLKETIEGLREAALELSTPYISGNVSLYNQTNGQSIPPTPVLAALGVAALDVARRSNQTPQPGHFAVLLGTPSSDLTASFLTDYDFDQSQPDIPLESPNWHEVRQLASFCQASIKEESLVHGMLASVGILGSLLRLCLRLNCGFEAKADFIAENDATAEQIGFWYGDSKLPVIAITPSPNQMIDQANKIGLPSCLLGKLLADPSYFKTSTELSATQSLHPPSLPIGKGHTSMLDLAKICKIRNNSLVAAVPQFAP